MSNGSKFAESMLKGRMAETLVEDLLKASGNIVYRFGYEALVQNLVQLESNFDRYGEVGERIRAIPDFIVLDKKGEPQFAEVKFRWSPDAQLHENTIDLIERVEKYWNALIIFVNCAEKPYFRVCVPPYFKTVSQPNKGLNFIPLTDMKVWNISPEEYAQAELLVEKYLTPTMNKN